jgi:uncharacterized membrane protein YvbJ
MIEIAFIYIGDSPKECPKCGCLNNEDNTICFNCGRRFKSRKKQDRTILE